VGGTDRSTKKLFFAWVIIFEEKAIFPAKVTTHPQIDILDPLPQKSMIVPKKMGVKFAFPF
jgi:hypothetical protein